MWRKENGGKKGIKKEKVKKNTKIDLNVINYFYKFFQTYFTYFSLLLERLNNLKIYKF